MNIYNHTAALFMGQTVTLAALRVMLLGAGYTFAATETALTTAKAQEVSGNGWTAGGETLASVAVTVVTTNDAMLDANDVSKTASGGAIGPASSMVIFDNTGANDAARKPLFHFVFPSAKTADDGTPFIITWHANGIARSTVT